jgi:hypothetical protein
VHEGRKSSAGERQQKGPQNAKTWLNLPLTNLTTWNVRRVYNDRILFRRQWTHLFLAAKQASTHVTNYSSVPLSTVLVAMVVSVGQVVVATIVRHCGNRTPARWCLRRSRCC